MAWRDWLPGGSRWTFAARPATPPTPSFRPAGTPAGTSAGPRPDAVTAAAVDVADYAGHTRFSPGDQGWQNELWDYFETLGEFAFVVNWKANTASRVRLRAGKIDPDADEPTIEDKGTAADLVRKLGGGVGGQSTLVSDLMIQLSVPAEGWLVGEVKDGVEYWCVKSNTEIRRTRTRGQARTDVYEVIDEYAPPTSAEWRELSPDSLVVRVWRPHPRRHNEASSPARSARTTMRELELINRKIVAQYLSRLASAGILLLPDEMEFPVRPEYEEAANPFFQELVAVASEAIRTPGSAAAAVPIPLTGPAELIEKVRHLDLSIALDEKEVEKRDSVLRRLATQLDVPGEILTGMGDINHWGAWAIDEQAVRTHVCPDIELICHALTVGYLRPRLAAMGEDPAEWAVWYDASEIIQRPDKSQHADVAYKSLELSPEAYRREMGFDEADAPTDEQVQEMILKRLAVEPAIGLELIKYVGDVAQLLKDQEEEANQPPPVPPAPPGQPPADGEQAPPADAPNGPPETEGQPPPAAGMMPAQPEQQPAQTAGAGEPNVRVSYDEYLTRLVDQSKLSHAVTYSAVGSPVLMHPLACREHLPSCPFTHAFARHAPAFRPGTSGTYECRMTTDGALALGQRLMSTLDDYVSYTPNKLKFTRTKVNGAQVRG